LEESTIVEKDGEWLHELALNNTVLETLNFYMTYLEKVRFEDLELIARNCRSLVSVKVSDYEILELQGFFRAATALEEFCGGSFNEQPLGYSVVALPPNLCRLGLSYMGKNEMAVVFPFASLLKKLDLLYTLLDTDDHCLLIQRCPNLEVLEVESQNHIFYFSPLYIYIYYFIFSFGLNYGFYLISEILRHHICTFLNRLLFLVFLPRFFAVCYSTIY